MTEATIQKAVKITVGISTDPRVAHIGRYFASLSDVTGRTNNQLTTRVNDAAGIAEFIADVKAQAEPMNIQVIVEDQTGELNL